MANVVILVCAYTLRLVVRDAEDHINWLLQHGWHEKALEAVEANQGQSELLDEVFNLNLVLVLKGLMLK